MDSKELSANDKQRDQPPGNADFTVRNSSVGRLFAFRLLFKGDKYGNGAIWGQPFGEPRHHLDLYPESNIGIEVYDATYAAQPRFKPEGQVICQYNLATLLSVGPSSRPYQHAFQYLGLQLQGGVDAWALNVKDRLNMEDEIRGLIGLALKRDPYFDERKTNALQAFAQESNAFPRLRLVLPDESKVVVSSPCFKKGNQVVMHGVIENFRPENDRYDVWFPEVEKYAEYGRDEVMLSETGKLKSWGEAAVFEPIFSPANRDYGDLPYRMADFLRIAEGNEDIARELFGLCSEPSSIYPHPETVWDEIGGAEFFKEMPETNNHGMKG